MAKELAARPAVALGREADAPARAAKDRRRVSLRYKLFLALLVTTLLPYAAASWAVYDRIEAGSRAQMLAQARATGKLAEALYEQRGLALESAAKTVALSNEVQLATFKKDRSGLVDALVPKEGQLAVTNITVTDPNGDVLMRSNDPQNWGDNISNRIAGVRLALDGKASWGAEVDAATGLVLRGSHPIYYGTYLLGAVTITERVTSEIVGKAEQAIGFESSLFSFEGQSTPVLADVQGNVLVGPELPGAVVKEVLASGHDQNFLAEVGGRALGGYAWPLYDADHQLVGAIAVVTSLKEIEQAQEGVLRAFTILGLAVLLIDVLIAWLLSRALINPLGRLTLAAAQIAGGDYAQPVRVRTHDEIGTLARALDQMRERVGEANRALREQTAQSEAERNVVNAVLDSTRDGIVMFDAAGKLAVANERWEAFFGLPRRTVAGATAEAILQQAAAAAAEPVRFAAHMATLLAGGEPEGNPIFEVVRPQKRFLRCYAAPVRDRAGGAIGRIFVFQDITRERVSEELKSALVSTVTHELRTPLAAIKGFARTLLIENADWDEPTRREFLTTIAEESDKLDELVANLLETSKIEAGVLQVARQPIRLGPVIERVVARHRGQDPDRSITVALDLDLPVVEADPRRLEQVLHNLIENAEKYSRPGTPIVVAAERSAEGDAVRVSVRDAGIGIAPEHLEHIFERFYRVDNSLVRHAGGTGLGLTISRGIIEAHGGRMWAESTPGEGSTFYFTLPVEASRRHGGRGTVDGERPLPAGEGSGEGARSPLPLGEG